MFPWEANNLFKLHQICVAGQQCCTLQSCRMSWSSSHWPYPSGEWLALHHRFPCQTQFLFDTFIWPSHNFFSPGFKKGIKYIYFFNNVTFQRVTPVRGLLKGTVTHIWTIMQEDINWYSKEMLPSGCWGLIQTAVTEFHPKYEVDMCDFISNLQILSGC